MAQESKIYFHMHHHLAGSFHAMHLCRAGLDIYVEPIKDYCCVWLKAVYHVVVDVH